MCIKGLFFSLGCGIVTPGLPKTAYPVSVRRIMAITSAFQADDAGSIPAARSKSSSDTFQKLHFPI